MIMVRPMILISNDDGIEAEGLVALRAGLDTLGDVWVVAPTVERSATSHGLSLHAPLRIKAQGAQTYAIDGLPADCVYVALHGLLPRMPDVIVSGINHGANMGHDVLYSGTVAAAMEGCLAGVPVAVAASLVGGEALCAKRRAQAFSKAAAKIGQFVLRAMADPPKKPVVLNLNFPDPARFSEPASMQLCRLGKAPWRQSVVKRQDPRGRGYVWIGGERLDHEGEPGSDVAWLHAGHSTLTPLDADRTALGSWSQVESLLEGTGSAKPEQSSSDQGLDPKYAYAGR